MSKVFRDFIKKVKIIEVVKSFNITANANFNSFNQGTTLKFQITLPDNETLTQQEDEDLFLQAYNATMRNVRLLAEIDSDIATILIGRKLELEAIKKTEEKAKLKRELSHLQGDKEIDYSDSMPSVKKPNKITRDNTP